MNRRDILKALGIIPLSLIATKTQAAIYLKKKAAAGGGSPVLEDYLASDTGGSNIANITVDRVTGIVNGELLIIMMGNDDTAAASQIGTLTGWTKFIEGGDANADCKLACFWRIADGTESATEVISNGANLEAWAWYMRISGAHATSPIHSQTAIGVSGSLSPGCYFRGITPSMDNTLCVSLNAYDGGDILPILGVSTAGDFVLEDEHASGTTGNDAAGAFGVYSQSAAALVGYTYYNTTNEDGVAYMSFAIAPA